MVHVESDQFVDLPKLTLPGNITFVYHDNADLMDSTCESLLQRAQLDSSHPLVIGFDVKYEVEPDGRGGVVSKAGSSSCDVVQIALTDTVYIFKVSYISNI